MLFSTERLQNDVSVQFHPLPLLNLLDKNGNQELMNSTLYYLSSAAESFRSNPNNPEFINKVVEMGEHNLILINNHDPKFQLSESGLLGIAGYAMLKPDAVSGAEVAGYQTPNSTGFSIRSPAACEPLFRCHFAFVNFTLDSRAIQSRGAL